MSDNFVIIVYPTQELQTVVPKNFMKTPHRGTPLLAKQVLLPISVKNDQQTLPHHRARYTDSARSPLLYTRGEYYSHV